MTALSPKADISATGGSGEFMSTRPSSNPYGTCGYNTASIGGFISLPEFVGSGSHARHLHLTASPVLPHQLFSSGLLS